MSMQNSGEALTPGQAANQIARAEARSFQGRLANVTPSEGEVATPQGLPYMVLRQHNPDYDAEFWHRCKALYAGGKKLLGDHMIMKEIFPKHREEHDEVYAERKKRAFYVPYAGEIIDHIVAALIAQPITMTTEGQGDDAWPDYYDLFYKDTSTPNGKELANPGATQRA